MHTSTRLDILPPDKRTNRTVFLKKKFERFHAKFFYRPYRHFNLVSVYSKDNEPLGDGFMV